MSKPYEDTEDAGFFRQLYQIPPAFEIDCAAEHIAGQVSRTAHFEDGSFKRAVFFIIASFEAVKEFGFSGAVKMLVESECQALKPPPDSSPILEWLEIAI